MNARIDVGACVRRLREEHLFLVGAFASAWLCLVVPVFAQEAYYWTYAQHPDLSYFDHPPMTAWLIWLGTHLLGDGAAGIRFGTWLCSLGTAWFGLLLLREFGVDAAGRRIWLVLGLGSPILAMTRFLANPDPPLVCFWTITIWALWRVRQGAASAWLLAGLAAGSALLSKYTAVFLSIGGTATLLLDPVMRRQLRTRWPYLGVLLAAVVFLPVVVWNVRHDFESFRFQTTHRFEQGALGARWLLEFVSEQFGVLHPVLALLLPVSVWWLSRRAIAGDARARWLLAFGLPLPAYLLFSSLWIQVKINWVAPAYVPLLLGLVVWWREGAFALRSPRLARAIAASVLVVPAVLPFAPVVNVIPSGRGSSWSGWGEIAHVAEVWEDRIDGEDGIEGNVFFFAADYRDAAQLGRNLQLEWRSEGELEGGEPTLAQNVLGKPGLQFDHWAAPRNRIGQDAIFVLPRPEQRAEQLQDVRDHFAALQVVERVTVQRLGVRVIEADICVCRNYRGPDVPHASRARTASGG